MAKNKFVAEVTFNIAKNTNININMMDINANLLQWFINFLMK